MSETLDIKVEKLQIAGYNVRQILCKNDDCRRILGYERMKVGVLIFVCPACEKVTVIRSRYSKMAQDVDKLIDDVTNKEGGE